MARLSGWWGRGGVSHALICSYTQVSSAVGTCRRQWLPSSLAYRETEAAVAQTNIRRGRHVRDPEPCARDQDGRQGSSQAIAREIVPGGHPGAGGADPSPAGTRNLPRQRRSGRGGWRGFLLRADNSVSSALCGDLHRGLQRRVFEESGGELGFSMGWGSAVAEARARLERGKRRPWESLLSNGNGWTPEAWHRPPISPPCEICGRLRADTEGREPGVCSMCRQATRIGERLTTWARLRPVAKPEPQSISALGVHFGQAMPSSPEAFQVRREIPRHPAGDPLRLLTDRSWG